METPLTPLEFARRARKLYPERVAVIDGESRWDLCAVSRSVRSLVSGLAGVWERLGRSRRLSRAQYSCAVGVVHSVPQLGAVLVPLNFLLIADDFLYLLNHSGARIVCAHRDYLETIDSIRSRLPRVEHFIALTGEGNDWLDYETLLSARDDDDRFLVVIAHRAAQS